MKKKTRARWLLFFLPSIVLYGIGIYVLTKAPHIRGAGYMIMFIASWFSIIGDIIRRADKNQDPHGAGIKKLTKSQVKKVKF